jgi:hypothetical protein
MAGLHGLVWLSSMLRVPRKKKKNETGTLIRSYDDGRTALPGAVNMKPL